MLYVKQICDGGGRVDWLWWLGLYLKFFLVLYGGFVCWYGSRLTWPGNLLMILFAVIGIADMILALVADFKLRKDHLAYMQKLQQWAIKYGVSPVS